MGKFSLNTIAFVKLSGEPVFLLEETPSEMYRARRFVRSTTGSHYTTEYFSVHELETEEEAKARFEKSLDLIGLDPRELIQAATAKVPTN